MASSDGPIVLYHGPGCADGFTAAWIAHKKFKHHALYIPVQYNQPVPTMDLPGRDLYILDFSFDADILRDLASKARSVIVLDHHKTAKDKLIGVKADNLTIVFDMEKSGARLTWEYFFKEEQVPLLVDYTEDRDLWRWKLPNSRELSAYLASREWSFGNWDSYEFGLSITESNVMMVRCGKAILAYQSQQVDNICKTAREGVIAGYRVMGANTPILQSEVGEKLALDRPFGVCYYMRPDGNYVYSLRSRVQTDKPAMDVSQIAKSMGGGGHPQAAGFTLDFNIFAI